MTIRIALGDWPTQKTAAQAIRYAVFVLEQKVPLEMEWDQMDAQCVHAVAFMPDGAGVERAVGTGRLLPDGHIGRMAVHKEARGSGVGAALLLALMQQAQQRGERQVELSAQTHAEAFYARHGFVREGEQYQDAGIPHVHMRHIF
ncbi:GNAT family N-acetyltransferase [Herminiimonas sp. CN]|uniref:GNAT family N-acetyltransferase n=1 Tax=Herminiimonas sp. CN TaxID=1349818 RepID=UPI0004741F98|nr:GNAT family N-acetyltransferase [Herminiimonas sp. CN]